MKKILAVNLIVILVLFGICEFLSYLYLKNDAKEFFEDYNRAAKASGKSLLSQRYAPVKYFDNADFEGAFRKTIAGKNPGILFFGCSYTYGSLVNESETLSYFTNKFSQNTVINRGIPAGGPYNMLRDLNDKDFVSFVNNISEIEYIVYVYINDHLNRLFNPYMASLIDNSDPYYKIRVMYNKKGEKYVYEEPSRLKLLLYVPYCVRAFYFFWSQKLSGETRSERLVNVLNEAKSLAQKDFPHAKFVILEYKDGSGVLLDNNTRNILKSAGFTVLDAETLAGHELKSAAWRAEDKEHPNGAAFRDVAKGLVKALKL